MSDRTYKLRLPVMQRSCGNCGLDVTQHVDGKCLFEASDYLPGKVRTERKTVKARITCGRCGGTAKDPEHEGACGECQPTPD